MTIIQRLVFPEPRICASEGLFYRTVNELGSCKIVRNGQNHGVWLDGGATISFDTYFNALSAQKWNELCDLEAFVLALVIDGDADATVVQKWLELGELRESVIWQAKLRSSEPTEHRIRLDPIGARGLWCLRLQAGSQGVILHEGHFEAANANPRQINLAAVMCTYKREAFVRKNVEILTERIFHNPRSNAHGHMTLFLVDNASSLDLTPPTEHVKIIRNRNTGGTGGFTRGLMEAQEDLKNGKRAFTHCLFLDDDITLHPESLERLIALLRLLKPRYASAFVNGAMIKAHEPTLQQEKRAAWTGDAPKGVKQNFRLTELTDILRNEYEPEPASSYVPWWFCCFPMHAAAKNLPFPFFVRGDDIEFSLRHSPVVLSLNGICVWHEAFERKPGEFMRFYFNARNYLVIRSVRAKRPPKPMRVAYEMVRDVLSQLLRLNYVTPRLILRAHRDFLGGTQFFRETDPQSILAEVTSVAEKWTPIGPEEEESFLAEHATDARPQGGKLHKILMLAFLNGHLIPSQCLASRGILFERMGAKGLPVLLGCKSLVIYDGLAGLFTTREISRKAFAKIALDTVRTACALTLNFRNASNDFRANFDSLTTERFWRSYLGLDSS